MPHCHYIAPHADVTHQKIPSACRMQHSSALRSWKERLVLQNSTCRWQPARARTYCRHLPWVQTFSPSHTVQVAAAAAAEFAEAQQAATHASAEDGSRIAQLQSSVQDLQREVQDLRNRSSSSDTSQQHVAGNGLEASGRQPDRQRPNQGAESAGPASNGGAEQQPASDAAKAEPQNSRDANRSREAASSAASSKAMAQLQARMDDVERGIALCKRKLVAGQEGSEGVAADVAGLHAQLAAEQVCCEQCTCSLPCNGHNAAGRQPDNLHASLPTHRGATVPVRHTSFGVG